MHIIDPVKFNQALKAKGYTSIGMFAKTLDLHRNTIHFYLAGHGVFPAALDKMMSALDVEPAEILIKKRAPNIERLQPILKILDALENEFPHVTFVLFGSRTRARPHPYADWDIGVFSADGMAHPLFRQIKRKMGDLSERFPQKMDCTNLNRADREFLQNISKGWIFLGGKLKDWVVLNQKALDAKTEGIH